MKPSIIGLFLILFVLLPGVTNAGGTVEDRTFYSESLGMDQDMRVYLPEGYDPKRGKKLPVVYFLHGTDYGYPIYWAWLDLQTTLDDLIASGAIEPLVFVTPNGLCEPYNGSWWTNSELYGNFEDYLVQDVVGFVESNYRVKAKRSRRTIMGLSMGGYGCMKVALGHPETFAAVASHSGAFNLDEYMALYREHVLEEAGEGPPYEYQESEFFSADMFSLSGALSPNLGNPPTLVDLPLDEWGEIRPDVMDRWRPHDPFYLASQLGEDCVPEIYFDVGTNDEYLFYSLNTSFAEELDDLGIPYEFQTFEGGHADMFHTRLPIGLEFLSSVMSGPGGIGGCQGGNDRAQDEDIAHTFDQGGAHLSGTNLETHSIAGGVQIHYAVPEAGHANLVIYDSSGRLIRNLLSEVESGGEHTVVWNGRDDAGRAVASGVYFSRLTVNGGVVGAGKVVLSR